ncbi:MAG: carboxypeptidase regulatory-like domain-containing protein [Planctomycetales bacterium]|nr:carboxypeptidase regulatory-like domain-containing protein [Planctomycetales bacterium]
MARRISLRNRSWRPQRLIGERARRQRRVRGAVAAVSLLALLAGFVWMVRRPMQHVNTQVALLTVGANSQPGSYGAAYSSETLAALQALSPALYGLRSRDEAPAQPLELPSLATSQSLREIAAQLELEQTPSDALILHVAADGLVVNGEPRWLCSNFDPRQPELGAVEVKSVLDALAKRRAQVKLVIVDATDHVHDLRLGVIVDDFANRLASLVEQRDDENLWVLTSHATHERPRMSPALRRSAFSLFVTEGLRGAADLNQDQQITVDELHRFVLSHVSEWSRQATSGRETQTPQLLHPARAAGAERQVLLSVAEVPPEERSLNLEAVLNHAETRRQWLPPTSLAALESAERSAFVERLPPLPDSADNFEARWQQWQNFVTQLTDLPQPAAVREDKGSSGGADGADASQDSSSSEEPSSSGEGAPKPDPYTQRERQLHRERTELIEQLLAWRDAVRGDVHRHHQVLERVPHLWREFETRLLLAWDDLSWQPPRAGDTRYEELRRVAPTIQALASGDRQLPDARRGLARRFADAWGDDAGPPPAENLGYRIWRLRDPRDRELARQVDMAAMAADPPDPAKIWPEPLPAELQRLAEVQLLVRIASREAIPWSHRRLALCAERLAHQVAQFGQHTTPWVSAWIERGDTLRADALQLLANDDAPQQLESLRQRLQAACDSYLDAADAIQTIVVAKMICNRCLYDFPGVLDWAANSINASPDQSPPRDRLLLLFRHVKHLSRLLAEAEPSTLAEVRAEVSLAARQLELVGAGWARETLDALANTTLPADRVGLDAVVRLTLVDAGTRSTLLANQLAMDRELVANFTPPTIMTRPNNSPQTSATQRHWVAYQEILRAAAELASLGARLSDANGAAQLNELDKPLAQFETAIERRASEATRWQAAADVEQHVQSLLAELPAMISATAAAPNLRWPDLDSIHCALLVLDPRDAPLLASSHLSQLTQDRQLRELLAWQRKSAWLHQAFASDSARRALARRADELALAARQRAPEATLALDLRPHLEVQVTESVTALETAQPITVLLQNHDTASLRVWVLADANEQQVALDRRAARVYALSSNVDDEALLRADSPPSLTLQPGESRDLSIPLSIVAEAIGSAPVRIRVIAAAHDNSLVSPASADLLQRGVVPVRVENSYEERRTWIVAPRIPNVALDVRGPQNSVAPLRDGYQLLAFPNRDTTFHLALTTESQQAQTYRVRLLAPANELLARHASFPAGSLHRNQAESLLSELGPLRPIVEPLVVKLDGDHPSQPFPFPKQSAAPEQDGPPADHAPEANGAEAAPTTLPGTIILVIEDQDSEYRMLRRLSLQVQHPRRFARPRVRYSLERQRIEVEVAAKPGAELPQNAVQADIALDAPLVPGPASRLQAEFDASRTAQLHIDLPPIPGGAATVRVAIDNYPRAYTFRVRCDADADGELVEQESRVQVVEPVKYQNYLAPRRTVRARLQVDAPPGSFSSPDHYVEVGLDQAMDRDFLGDTTLRLYSDRELTAQIASSDSEGILTIRSRADDFAVDVPADGLRNIRANLLAQLRLGTVVAQDAAEEIWLDGLPPRLLVQDISPGRIVEVGGELKVVVDSRDEQRGFVAKVEAGFDKRGLGEFDPETPPVEGVKGDGAQWQFTIPTESLTPGRQTLLLRATDHVGNASPYTALRITVTPPLPKEAEDRGKIAGIIRYRQAPAEGAEIVVTPLDATVKVEHGEASSSNDGVFSISDLPLGKYRVTARLLRRNKRLKEDQEVEVLPASKTAKLLQFDFR